MSEARAENTKWDRTPTKCPHCPKVCTGPRGLSMHMKRSHSEAQAHAPGKANGHGGTLTSRVEKNEKGELICPNCPRAFKNAKGLGSHLRSGHGIKGSSPSVRATQLRKNRLNAHESNGNGSITIIPQEHDGKYGGLEPIALALTIGSIQEFCRHSAEEHDIPTRVFTRQVAELFYRQTRR